MCLHSGRKNRCRPQKTIRRLCGSFTAGPMRPASAISGRRRHGGGRWALIISSATTRELERQPQQLLGAKPIQRKNCASFMPAFRRSVTSLGARTKRQRGKKGTSERKQER